MKKLIIILFISCITNVNYSQINTTKIITEPSKDENSENSDLKNHYGKDVDKYIGQELYLNGIPETLRSFYYKYFYVDYKKDKYNNPKNIYRNDGKNKSNYSELFGKYFTVLDVIKENKSSKIYLKLQDKLNQEIFYYEYENSVFSFPFIRVDYYNQLKKQNIGKLFYLRNGSEINIKTGKPAVGLTYGSKWECVDVTIEEKNYELRLLVKNEKDEQILIPLKGFYFLNENEIKELEKRNTETTTSKIESNNLITCDIIKRKVDEFNGEKSFDFTVKSNDGSDVSIIKVVNKGISIYYLSIMIRESNIYRGNGVTIILKNGKKINKPNEKVESTYLGSDFYSKTFISLSKTDIALLKESGISKYKLYISTGDISEHSDKIKELFNCLLTIK